MAIFHCSIKNISRSSGKSAVASAAYRSGEKLHDDELGRTFSYAKSEVAYSEIFLCKNAPIEYGDRATLWNSVERIESQSNARLAREWEVALPNELTLDQGKELVKNFAKSLADEGMCVDASIHWKDGNHHAHIMGTTRQIKENGEWGQKEKKAYKLDELGEKVPIPDPDKVVDWMRKNNKNEFNLEEELARINAIQDKEERMENREQFLKDIQKIGARGRKMWERETIEANDWNKSAKIEEWRERWGNYCNKYLDDEHKISHLSYERQGVMLIPTVHEGYVARQMEQNGRIAERCEINRDIRSKNDEIAQEIKLINWRIEGQEAQKERAIKREEDELYGRFKAIGTIGTIEPGAADVGEAGRTAEDNSPFDRGQGQLIETEDELGQRTAELEEKIDKFGVTNERTGETATETRPEQGAGGNDGRQRLLDERSRQRATIKQEFEESIDGVGNGIKGKIDEAGDGITSKIDRVRGRIASKIDEARARIKAEFERISRKSVQRIAEKESVEPKPKPELKPEPPKKESIRDKLAHIKMEQEAEEKRLLEKHKEYQKAYITALEGLKVQTEWMQENGLEAEPLPQSNGDYQEAFKRALETFRANDSTIDAVGQSNTCYVACSDSESYLRLNKTIYPHNRARVAPLGPEEHARSRGISR